MFYDNLTTHRIAAGLKKTELNKLSDVSVNTISRAEKHESVSAEYLNKIITALNKTEHFRANPIKPEIEIKAKSIYGAVPKIIQETANEVVNKARSS